MKPPKQTLSKASCTVSMAQFGSVLESWRRGDSLRDVTRDSRKKCARRNRALRADPCPPGLSALRKGSGRALITMLHNIADNARPIPILYTFPPFQLVRQDRTLTQSMNRVKKKKNGDQGKTSRFSSFAEFIEFRHRHF